MDSQTMTVIFVVAAVVLSALEIAMPGFVLLPFGLGAAVAAIAGALGASPFSQVVVFLVASTVFFFALRPLSRRLNEVGPAQGIGSERLIGANGTVLEHIAAGDTGMVRIDREEWRAEAATGQVLVPGMAVKVVEVRGTRVLVVVDHVEPLGRREGTNP
jgi:membrane protein implicated in regulation of membrane protease activity